MLTPHTPCPSISRQVAKDAFHLESVWEVLNRLKDLHMEEAKADADSKPRTRDAHLGALRSTYAPYLPLIAAARGRLTAAHEKDELGTLAVFYKTTGEICCLAQAYEDGEDTARGVAPPARQGGQLRRVEPRRRLQLAPLDRAGEQPAPLRGGQR